MHFEVIRTPEALDALADEWNNLLEHSARAVPFLRHEYLAAWWQTRGGGEWPEGELFVVTARLADGSLVGIAPFFFTNNLESKPALLLLGSIEISDYLDVIARPEDLPDFISGLLEFLKGHEASGPQAPGPQAPAWCVLDLYNLLADSPTLPVLEEAARKMGWEFTQEDLHPCPIIMLPGDWEQYLAGIDKKQRHEIRRKMRRAAESEQGVSWYIVDGSRDLEAEIEAFLTLMAHDPDKGRFLSGPMREQQRLAMRAAYKAGYLQLAFLEVGNEKAAAYLNFDYGGRIWVYNSGYNPSFGELSVGWVLLGELLKWANENQREAFDFMRGTETYKYRFGAVDRRIVRASVRRLLPAG